jgi:putative FmdB family regulatory protein
MPTYEYKCPCDNLISMQRDIDDRDLPIHCECGKTMSRTWHSPGVQFLGTGFYTTDKVRK